MARTEHRLRMIWTPLPFVAIALGALLCSLAFVATAAATPTVAVKLKAIPIAGFPGTGEILGAGAEVEDQVSISGTEYDGFPSPLTGLNVYAPAGVKINPKGFPTCAPAALSADGPEACPRDSAAGPKGIGVGATALGATLVPETVSIQQFFAPSDRLTFYVEGSTPISFHFLENAHWVTAGAPYGPEVIVEVPLIETLPGADDASVLSFTVKIGAAYKKGRKTISYITNPKRCPTGGFPVKSELKFLSGETVTVAHKLPCPRH